MVLKEMQDFCPQQYFEKFCVLPSIPSSVIEMIKEHCAQPALGFRSGSNIVFQAKKRCEAQVGSSGLEASVGEERGAGGGGGGRKGLQNRTILYICRHILR